MAPILPLLIRTRLGTGPRTIRKAAAGLLLARRILIQTLRRAPQNKAILFIFGSQRSGTTMLSQIFEGDARVSPFSEHSAQLARDDHPLRLDDLSSVERVFERARGSLIVAKPLVESQRAGSLLDHFASARAVWMYRNYRDVIRSYVKLFQRAGINIARKIVEQEDNWASERVSEQTRAIVESHYSEEMSLFDAAALFWWVRNGWYFDLSLHDHERVMLCRYEELVSHPDTVMQQIYGFVELPYPGAHLVEGVHPSSKGLGRSVELSPAIDRLCAERLEQLDASLRAQVRSKGSGTPHPVGAQEAG